MDDGKPWPRFDPITNRLICLHCWANEHHPANDVNGCRCVCRDPVPPRKRRVKPVTMGLCAKPELKYVERKG